MIHGHQPLHGRLAVLWAVIAAVGVLLGLRLVQLQIIDRGEYRLAAERNRSQMIYRTAPRGRLFDRNGTAVATNQPAFSLIYLPAKDKNKEDLRPLAEDLARELRQDPEALLETLEQAVREQTALRLAENLPPKVMFRLSEIKTIYPGVDLIVEARRYYPFGAFASHLIGYMGKMDPRSWKELKTKGYRADSRIGRMGLESVFERELRGRDGGLRMEVDAQGRLKRVLERLDWLPGSNVYLTLDAPTQRAADDGLRKSVSGRGALVALDPRSGAILALSSAPDFDPNNMLSWDPEVSRKQLAELPELNLAIAGAYAPGSTFKPLVGLAGFAEEKLRPEESIFCPGYFELGRRIALCWDPKGHQKVSWLMALAKSCDVYFYEKGLQITGPVIEKYARMFGFGQKTRIALKGERAGLNFGPAARAANHRAWYDGDTINQAIGQGELLATPIQMAVMIAAIGNRGTIWRPHYTDRIEYVDGTPEYKHRPEKVSHVELPARAWDLVQEALALVVSSGTARGLAIPGVDFRGKTGTAQNPVGDDHAWFVAYGAKPGEEPSIAVAVIVENGGHGSSVAAPIAREVIRAWFRLETPKPAVVRSTGTLAVPLPARPLPATSPARGGF